MGHARLRLSFSADSWVDVRDAAGRRMFAGNGRANSVRTIAGVAPMRVYLRSAVGKGSCFSMEVPLAASRPALDEDAERRILATLAVHFLDLQAGWRYCQ